MTYKEHWNLNALPFDNLPDPRFYFPSGQHEDARQRLLYGIQAMKGAAMLTGEIGSGKTLTSRALIRSLQKKHFDIALLTNPALPAADFLMEVLYQFGLETNGAKVDRLHRLNDHLLSNRRQQVKSVLMVDEAQSIQEISIFEDLRLLLNFQLNDRFLLTIVLLGQPELRDRVAAIPQLNQRLAIRYHLRPLTADETVDYIRFRMKAAGARPDVFTKDAVHEIFLLSSGVCRVINTVCDLCLLLGSQEGLAEITPSVVTQASQAL
jgi:general secretion pathway protein A